ncbi:small, acid-soluble spore protein K [Alkalihalobacillus trypoxylicola]|uniref:Small, acid-soluble spore protein K n=1 Tax=Alkalihalobacillus trypoxylicola TaxID=519424 RepID=A0A162CWP7_9BACI|nr:small, acid-soluble spore protein K [Alkalihalobacillus trypoxylicola]KYG26949.1 small, acid-soluble spore protein K [Alkalihalobacillus trypoxylicola]GAF66574.1 hypothetical protein BTS2_3475 [Bacillus sp. TS-2]
MRNKAKGFPQHIKFSGSTLEKDLHSSKRADGSINTQPRERMHSANQSKNR